MMKTKNLILFFTILVIFISCNKDEEHQSPDCVSFAEALVYYRTDSIKIVIDELTNDLHPKKKENDRWGHRENVDLLIERLNVKCTNVTAVLWCYACIMTYPPQSEIILSTDSAGIEVKRVIDILTPDDDVLKYVNVHEYHWE
jgi:hypothetical protein